MSDKDLKIFGLDNNFSLDELEEKYKKLLKEFDTKNIEDDLKIIFLEEQVRIREAYQILLKYYHETERVDSIISSELPADTENMSTKASTSEAIPPIPNKIRKGKSTNWQSIILIGAGVLLLVIGGIIFSESLTSGDNLDKEITEEMLADRYTGQGTKTYANGKCYKGEWEKGKKNGQGIYTFPSGNKYVGEFKDNNFNGQGTKTYANGSIYAGEWKDDRKHGQGTKTYANGKYYEGEWRKGKKNGQGTKTYADGGKYVGEWKDDEWRGQGTYTFGKGQWEGDKYVGEWNGKKFKRGTYTDTDGRVRRVY